MQSDVIKEGTKNTQILHFIFDKLPLKERGAFTILESYDLSHILLKDQEFYNT